jgi:hypothetical protein
MGAAADSLLNRVEHKPVLRGWCPCVREHGQNAPRLTVSLATAASHGGQQGHLE